MFQTQINISESIIWYQLVPSTLVITSRWITYHHVCVLGIEFRHPNSAVLGAVILLPYIHGLNVRAVELRKNCTLIFRKFQILENKIPEIPKFWKNTSKSRSLRRSSPPAVHSPFGFPRSWTAPKLHIMNVTRSSAAKITAHFERTWKLTSTRTSDQWKYYRMCTFTLHPKCAVFVDVHIHATSKMCSFYAVVLQVYFRLLEVAVQLYCTGHSFSAVHIYRTAMMEITQSAP